MTGLVRVATHLPARAGFLDVASVGCVVFTIDVVCLSVRHALLSVTLFFTSVIFLDTFPLDYDVAIAIYDY